LNKKLVPIACHTSRASLAVDPEALRKQFSADVRDRSKIGGFDQQAQSRLRESRQRSSSMIKENIKAD
jgi:hypothetical protein